MRNKIVLSIRIIAVVVIIFSVLYIIKNEIEYKRAEKEYLTLSEYAETNDHTDSNRDKYDNIINVDYEGLKKINSDFIGWIFADNGKISYPLVQSRDNKEYLTKTFKGKYNKSGTIFADKSDNGLENYQSRIFGHCMKNGTMFAGLMRYKDKNYISEAPYFYIYMKDGIRKYEIFSVYRDFPENVIFMNNNTESERKKTYKEIKNMSDYNINTDDNVLSGSGAVATLITCDDKDDRYRVVVNGKRIK